MPPSPSPTPPRASSPPVRVRALPRTYRQSVSEPAVRGTSVVTFTLMLTAPAVLTAALLRPRGSGRRGR
ncbi:hypothetical protein ABZ442_08945 [Streptomyces triculaminicus]|uniref:hypothetical protein n=1 Tax=Streptomyces triculaminicus TaxID=2816232 RepID=UPI003410039E